MDRNKHEILITGATGLIGSNLVIKLAKLKYKKILLLDNFSSSRKEVLKKINNTYKFYKINLTNKKKVEKIFKENNIKLIIHLAAFTDAAKSFNKKNKFIFNNVNSTQNLIFFANKYKVYNFIFSSTAAIYGNPVFKKRISEKTKYSPINPYGYSKMISEKAIINNSQLNKKFNFLIFRFFNVVGRLMYNKFHKNKSKNLFDVILNKIEKKTTLKIYGNNFKTKDGTAIRDFIHVDDLCNALIHSINFLQKKKRNMILNLGCAKGYTVLTIVKTFNKLLKDKIKYVFFKKRKGDPVKSIADITKINTLLKWKIKYYNVSKLCKYFLNE
jgi:UDP-glucose 4-epimerase